ncbi:MAG: DEAD/DEAH box helicase family protein [Desulfuromonadales bacterium]
MNAHLMQQAMVADGLQPAEPIIADGVFRRIDAASGKPKNGLIFYVNHGNAGYYGHWSKMPEGRKWSAKRETEFTPEERQEYAKQMQQAREDQRRAEEQRHTECRERAKAIRESSKPAPADHPYLIKKGIQPHHAKIHNGNLIIPVYDVSNVLHGHQSIDESGTKKFLPGTTVKGNFSCIPGDNSKPFYLAEGYATAATIHEATGATVIIAFSCGNLKPVSEVIRARVGKDKTIIVCADNDRLRPDNPGLKHATAAAAAIGAGLATPLFPGDLGTDFNDLQHISGLPAVRAVLEAARPLPPTLDEIIKKYELRPYQQKLIEDVRKNILAGYHKIMVSSPTGSGKSIMFTHIIKLCHEKGLSVLFMVHRQEIIYQIAEYLDLFGIGYGVIKGGEKHDYHHHVQLAMFQTIARRLKSPYIRQADIIIIDEAHHATANTFLKSIQTFTKPDGIVLGFSATPARQSGQGLGNLFEIMLQVASISELIELGYLTPIKAFAPVRPDLTGVKLVAGDYNERQLETAVNTSKVVGDVVGHYLQYGDGRKSFCFAVTVAHAVALCTQFLAKGITAAVVSAKTSKGDREDIINRFKAGSIRIIINCQVLTEGFDCPDAGCVILARPTKSLVMYLQMVGRGMRAIPGKTDCILLDHSGAVFEHGFPDEIETWELSKDSKTVNKKQEKRKKKESEPICCPVCGLLYTGQLSCPGCGNIPTIKQLGKDIEYDLDAILGEIVRKPKPPKKPAEASSETKASWYRQLKLQCQRYGHNTGWTAHSFREKFGHWPNRYQNLPATDFVSNEVENWLTYQKIKRLKSPSRKAA